MVILLWQNQKKVACGEAALTHMQTNSYHSKGSLWTSVSQRHTTICAECHLAALL